MWPNEHLICQVDVTGSPVFAIQRRQRHLQSDVLQVLHMVLAVHRNVLTLLRFAGWRPYCTISNVLILSNAVLCPVSGPYPDPCAAD